MNVFSTINLHYNRTSGNAPQLTHDDSRYIGRRRFDETSTFASSLINHHLDGCDILVRCVTEHEYRERGSAAGDREMGDGREDGERMERGEAQETERWEGR
jgi:hypothetical protein